MALLSIENAEQVSISASVMRRPAIEEGAKTCAAPLPTKATAFELVLLVCAFALAARVGQSRAMWPTPPQA